MLENTEGAIRKMDNPEKLATRRRKTKHNTICVGHNYTQTNTKNVNKTWALLQTTGGKDEPTIVSFGLFCIFQCLDKVEGNGTCICNPGYAGTLCNECEDPNMYGPYCNQSKNSFYIEFSQI